MRQGTPISTQEFYDDLRHRMRAVWADAERVNPQAIYDKLATYQSFFAVPFDQYLLLELSTLIILTFLRTCLMLFRCLHK